MSLVPLNHVNLFNNQKEKKQNRINSFMAARAHRAVENVYLKQFEVVIDHKQITEITKKEINT